MNESAKDFNESELESLLKDNFKLSSYEARTYLSLIKLGNQNTKQISSNAGVPMPRIYDTLESLMAKGFVIQRESGYAPISPKQALSRRTLQFETQFESDQKKRKEAEQQLVLSLEELTPKISKESGEIAILRGIDSIANKFAELLEDSKDIILIAKRAIEARDVFIPLLIDYSSKKGGKKIRIIAPRETKITKKEAEEAKSAHAEIRRSDHVMFDMMITEKDDVIIGVPDPLSEELNHAVAIWVKNASFARSTRDSAEEIWKDAQKL
ncbi:MAG: TrmB family transcriptional regulator [Nitrososphaerota archaeon]|nr:TrmB family transcriptional regulator [Nitrososphaerota archaeon]